MRRIMKLLGCVFLLAAIFVLLPTGRSEAASGGEYLTHEAQIHKRLATLEPNSSWTFILSKDVELTDRITVDRGLKITFQSNGHVLTYREDAVTAVQGNATLSFVGQSKGFEIRGLDGVDGRGTRFPVKGGTLKMRGKVTVHYQITDNNPVFRAYEGGKIYMFGTTLYDSRSDDSIFKIENNSLLYMKGCNISFCGTENGAIIYNEDGRTILYDTKISRCYSGFATIAAVKGSMESGKSRVFLTGCSLVQNVGQQKTGGIFTNLSEVSLTDTTIWGNECLSEEGEVGAGLFAFETNRINLAGKIIIWNNKVGKTYSEESDVRLFAFEGRPRPVLHVGKFSPGSFIGIDGDTDRILTVGYKKSGNTEHPMKFFRCTFGRYIIRYNPIGKAPGTEAYMEFRLLAVREPRIQNAGYGKISISWTGYVGDYFMVQRKIGNGPLQTLYAGTNKSFTDKNASTSDVNYYRVIPYLIDTDGTKLKGRVAQFKAIRANLLAPIEEVFVSMHIDGTIGLSWSKDVPEAEGFLIYRREKGGSFEYVTRVKTNRYKEKAPSDTWSEREYMIYGYRILSNGTMILSAPGKIASVFNPFDILE